jgi:alpha-glucosidase
MIVAAGGVKVHMRPEELLLVFFRPDGSPMAADLEVGSRSNWIVTRKVLGPGQRVYGLGEKTGGLDKRGRRYIMRNTDVWLENPAGIGPATDPLYASFPVCIFHSLKGSYGIFVDNSEVSEFDFRYKGCYEIAVCAKVLNYYLLPGPTLSEVVRQYTDLTGRLELPPLWSLGYHQSRWGYASEKEFRAVAAALRRRQIPADGIWFDIDHMDGFRVFTWDKKRFPHPRKLMTDLAADGFHTVTILDPGVKVDEKYSVCLEGGRGGHFLRHQDGREYHGRVWAGRSAFPDFHNAATRSWWAKRVRRWLAATGVAGLWLDMNEPSSEDLSGPLEEVRHAGGTRRHFEARNTYGLNMADAVRQGMLIHRPDVRPFILTRAAFCGTQRVAALWGGDNSSVWEHLAASLPFLMNLGLSGMPFVGVDIGGFGGDATGELMARWMQLGAFYPFCRNHTARGTRAQEPWTFGREVEAICRKYLVFRYRLLPYIYNLFYEATRTGAPILRPLVWHYPQDESTFNLNDQCMLGPDLLLAPVLAPGLTVRAVYLPEGLWYRWKKGENARLQGPVHLSAAAPLDELPLFVRAGAVIPLWQPTCHTGAIDRESVCFHIWPGRGDFEFYEDDGASPAYRQGMYRLTSFRLRLNGEYLRLRWQRQRSSYGPGDSHWRMVFHGAAGGSAILDGRKIPHRITGESLLIEVPGNRGEHILEVKLPL